MKSCHRLRTADISLGSVGRLVGHQDFKDCRPRHQFWPRRKLGLTKWLRDDRVAGTFINHVTTDYH